MWNYLLILVTFLCIIECYSQEQEYDEVDYYIKEEGESAESSQVDKPYQQVENIENEAKGFLKKVVDAPEPKQTKSSNFKKVSENEVDISSEIETMLNKIKLSVFNGKKLKPQKKANPCPLGKELTNDTEKNEQLKEPKNCETSTKQLESDEIKHTKSEEKKEKRREERESENKSEPEIARSAKHRAMPKHFKQLIIPKETKTEKGPVMNDFYERDDFYTTEESEKTKPYINLEQSGSHEQYEEVTKPIKSHEHLKRGKYKTKEEISDQMVKPCNKPELEQKNINNDEISQQSLCTNCEKTKRVVTNTDEIKHSKSKRNNKQLESREQSKSAEEKRANFCKNCERFSQVEPYRSLKENRKSGHRMKNLNADENKEVVKTLTPKAMGSKNSKQHKHTRSQKNSENFEGEEFDNSEEATPVKPCKHHNRNIVNVETKPAKSLKTKYCDEDKTVEIEIRNVKLRKRIDSSEEQGKPCQHKKQTKVDEEIDNVTKTKNNKIHRPKRKHAKVDVRIEQPETRKDLAEQSDPIVKWDEVNAQNESTTIRGETKRKIQTTTVKNEEGKTKTLVSYPFSVSIQRKGAHYATGALLDKRWILTVAGEFFNVRETIKLYKARLGSVNCKRGGHLVAIKLIVIHPQYVYKEPNFDVALLMVAKPVEFSDLIRPIGLSSVKTKVISAKFLTNYWSRLIIKGQVLPTTANERIKQTSLRVSTQKLIPWEWCDTLMRIGNATLDHTTLCLRPIESHHSLCMPDAGAPVVAEDGLWGITSGWTSKNCRSQPSPTVFTRVSLPPVRSWLDFNMNKTLTKS